MASDKLVINQAVHEPVRTSIANPASDQEKWKHIMSMSQSGADKRNDLGLFIHQS